MCIPEQCNVALSVFEICINGIKNFYLTSLAQYHTFVTHAKH